MPIVTITSDWNDSSYYLPLLKGKILSAIPGVVFETISNSIEPFNIPQGCFVLKHSYRNFPKGTIHLMGVNSEPTENSPMIAVQHAGEWIVAPNDGRFSLLLGAAAIENGKAVAYEIPLPQEFSTFMAAECFTAAVDAVTNGTFASTLRVCGIKSVSGALPTVLPDRIIGKIVYIDSYGNAISNITREDFARGYMMWSGSNPNDPEFRIYVGGPQLTLDMIYNGYNDVDSGMDVALFNSIGLLEFAINNGSFSKVEGIGPNCEIMIKFY